MNEEEPDVSRSSGADLHTRIKDLQWAVGLFVGVITLIVAGLTVMNSLNLSSERSSLQTFKGEIKSEMRELLGSVAAPILTLWTVDGNELNQAVVDGWLAPNEIGPQIHFQYVIKNVGKGRSGPLFAKLYSSDVPLPDPDVDRTGYKFSTFIEPKQFSPPEVFGNMSMLYTLNIGMRKPLDTLDNLPELLVRLYYSNGQMTEAKFKVKQRP